MRLKDPLQGIKMIQGHTIIHIAMFISSFIIDAHPADEPPAGDPCYLELQIKAFLILRWSHFTLAILQSLSFILKMKKFN